MTTPTVLVATWRDGLFVVGGETQGEVALGDVIYVGTDDARVLRVDAKGELEPLRGFDEVAGRDTWYAGSALINSQRVGPPLEPAPSTGGRGLSRLSHRVEIVNPSL